MSLNQPELMPGEVGDFHMADRIGMRYNKSVSGGVGVELGTCRSYFFHTCAAGVIVNVETAGVVPGIRMEKEEDTPDVVNLDHGIGEIASQCRHHVVV